MGEHPVPFAIVVLCVDVCFHQRNTWLPPSLRFLCTWLCVSFFCLLFTLLFVSFLNNRIGF